MTGANTAYPIGESLPVVNEPSHVYYLPLQQMLQDQGIHLQALTEIVLEFIARTEVRPLAQLQEEMTGKKEAIAKRPAT